MSEIRLIAHHSFLIPAKKYIVDFDITTSVPFPAFLELSIYLLDTLKLISPHELQLFFGIDGNERDSLVQQILSTDLAFINDNGDLELTSKINELRQPDGSIQLEKYENHSDSCFVDLASKHIQPRPTSYSKVGFIDLIPKNNFFNELNIENIFTNEFNRFKLCTTNKNIKNSKSRLYRINACTYDSLVDFPVSVNVSAELQPDSHLQITTSLSGFEENDINLVVNSGVLRFINNELNKHPIDEILLPKDYYSIAQDRVLPDFFSDSGEFDIQKYLVAREKKKTGYGSQKTTGLLGAIYLPKNKSKLIEWLRKVSNIRPIFWMPSSSTYWGASAYTKVFYDELKNLLHEKGSFLSLILPKIDTKQEKYMLKQRFAGLVNAIYCFPASDPLDEVEIMIVPGSPCWAMVQYHARISPNYGLRNIRIPIGYVTYDAEQVKNIWTFLSNKINFNGNEIEVLTHKSNYQSDIPDCLTDNKIW